jgi:hypothetical protein
MPKKQPNTNGSKKKVVSKTDDNDYDKIDDHNDVFFVYDDLSGTIIPIE